MKSNKSRSVEAKITRLTREIAEIDDFFYNINNERDREQCAGMLERKRDDMVRSSVLQLHTAIEDILTEIILCYALEAKPEELGRKMRGSSAQALGNMLFGERSIGFVMKLNFAVALRILNKKKKDRLIELNRLRNRCSHNWLLKAPVRRGKRPKQKKPPLLMYRGRDLHKVAVLKDFVDEYGAIYVRLFGKYCG